MKFNTSKTAAHTNFTLYLEGKQVSFNTIAIRESIGSAPSAAISFPAGSGALRVLPGTIVQCFGEIIHAGKVEDILLFEGEVSSISYQKDSTQRSCTLQCVGLMKSLLEARKASQDALISKTKNEASAGTEKVLIATDGTISGNLTNVQLYNLRLNEGAISLKSLKDLNFFSRTGFSAYLLEKLNDEKFKSGDFQGFIEEVEAYFQIHNAYYGIKSQSYKLKQSLCSLPNPLGGSPFMSHLVEQSIKEINNLNTGAGFTSSQTALWEIIAQFLNTMKYGIYFPASFPKARMFYNSQDTKKHNPIRGFMLPILDNAPPAWCNVVFPDQVTSFNYSRNYGAEPTRAIASSTMSAIKGTMFEKLTPFFLVPYLETETVPDSTNSDKPTFMTKWTTEESYRGVNLQEVPISSAILRAFKKLEKDSNKDSTEASTWTTESPFYQILRYEAFKAFTDARAASKELQIQTDWCPYRFVGVPGLMIDLRGPSIMGTLSSISTTISADGAAQQSLSFSNPRLIYEDSQFASTQGVEEKDPAEYLINDFSSFGLVGNTSFYHNEDLYGFSNIGKDVYTYLIHGTANKRELFKTLQEDKGIFEDIEFDEFYTEKHGSFDASILSVLRDGGDIVLPDALTKEGEPSEIKNAKLMYESVKKIKEQYLKTAGEKTKATDFTTTKALKAWTENHNYRPIIAKKEYLQFIGATNSEHKEDYKDIEKMIHSTDTSLANFKKLVFDDVAENATASHAANLLEQKELARKENEKASEAYFETQTAKTKRAFELEHWEVLKAQYKVTEVSGFDGSSSWDYTWAWKKSTEEAWKIKVDEVTKAYEEASQKWGAIQGELAQTNKTLEEIKENYIDVDESLFKPYNINRYRHIKEAFKVKTVPLSNKKITLVD